MLCSGSPPSSPWSEIGFAVDRRACVRVGGEEEGGEEVEVKKGLGYEVGFGNLSSKGGGGVGFWV